MGYIGTNQPKRSPGAFVYFVLSFCLLVPTVGPLVFFIVLYHVENSQLAFGVAACVCLMSVILGLFGVKRFREYNRHAEFWFLIVGVALCGIVGLMAAGALLLVSAAAALHID